MNSSTDYSPVNYKSLVNKLTKTVNEHVLAQMTTMLNIAPDLINTRASGSTNHREQEKLFTIYRILKNQHEELKHNFFIALNDKLKPTTTGTLETDSELSLVSQTEMDEMVIMTTISAHAVNYYGDQIDNLETRLEYVEISAEGMLRKDSLSPLRICEAYQSTLQGFTIEQEHKAELFKLFDEHVIAYLESMYSELNEILIDAGVMPSIVLKSSREYADEEPEISVKQVKTEITQDRPSQFARPGQDATASSAPESSSHNARSSQFYIPHNPGEYSRFAQHMINGDITAPKSAKHIPESFTRPVSKKELDGTKYYDRNEVVRALSRLQNKIIEGGREQQQVGIKEIKRSLFNDMAEQSGGVVTKQVNVLDERSIDFVGMMFDAITHDESIAMIIKNLLLRLQIPVIKVAMSDTELFEQENHPTSEVLDLITEAGKGVNEETDRVYSDLEEVVDEILQEFDVDISSFINAAEELRHLIENEQNITDENERHEQRQIFFNNAREIIVNELRHITSKKSVPKNVLPLITKNWPSLMINRYAKHGKESWQWLESIMLIKLLINCLQPIKNSSQWQAVWRNHIAIVDAVHNELKQTGQEQSIIDQQVSELKDIFVDHLDAFGKRMVEDARLTSETMFEHADPEKEAEIAARRMQAANDNTDITLQDSEDLRDTHINKVATLSKARINKLPDAVHPGVWFEVYNGEGNAIRRLKLSVILTDVAKLIFVDRKGAKVIEKDAADFAAELESNQSRIIADHSTFDHALGQVIHSMAA